MSNKSNDQTVIALAPPAHQISSVSISRKDERFMLQRHEIQLNDICFGIAASSKFWKNRKEYIKLWWKPGKTRGVVWLDEHVRIGKNEGLPEIRISGNTSNLPYKNPKGMRSALRISRVVSETLRLGMENVKWFVMGDDDTVFVVDNLVRVLSKYDYNQYYYIGSSSESHIQNIHFSTGMAYGGGGFAISYPLAKQLEKMQDRCINRYPGLYGSDDRMHACMSELGVPLTRELGFHQYDVYGDLYGLLAAHPVTPLVSIHHLDLVTPIFPKLNRVQSVRRLLESAHYDSASLIQQSICYHNKLHWSISISWGYAVQIIRGIVSPKDLEIPARTFLNWYRKADYTAYAFNTRPAKTHPCQRPFVFYLSKINYDRKKNHVIGIYSYTPHKGSQPRCHWKTESPARITSVIVMKTPDNNRWLKSPRRDCCRTVQAKRKSTLYLWVKNCNERTFI